MTLKFPRTYSIEFAIKISMNRALRRCKAVTQKLQILIHGLKIALLTELGICGERHLVEDGSLRRRASLRRASSKKWRNVLAPSLTDSLDLDTDLFQLYTSDSLQISARLWIQELNI
jgi:hypothetical protein